MKVLQTLGRRGKHEGVFRYRRNAQTILIILLCSGEAHEIPNDLWVRIIEKIREKTSTAGKKGVSITELYEIIQETSNESACGLQRDLFASIVAILEHEGTIDFCHGGPNAIRLSLDDYLDDTEEEEDS